MLGTVTKGSTDTLLYTVDWVEWLADGDSIASASFTVPAGMTKLSQTHTTTQSKVLISGGTIGITYVVSCSIVTTVSQETKNETFALYISH